MGDNDQNEADQARAALSRAQTETADALTAGPCCSRDLEGLRFQIISLLSCDACQDMSFQVGNIRIDGSLYRAVSQALRNPDHTIHVSASANLKDQNGKAESGEYNPVKRRLTFAFSEIGGKPQDVSDRCQTIIHECTHAGLHLAKISTSRFTNETAAWFAGVLFLKGQSLPYDDSTDFRKSLSMLADDARHANVGKQIYTMPANAVAYLKQQLTAGYGFPDFQETQ